MGERRGNRGTSRFIQKAKNDVLGTNMRVAQRMSVTFGRGEDDPRRKAESIN